VEPEVEVHLPLAGLIDFAAERARVEKEIARSEGELQGLRKRLDNEGFVARAPREVVEKDRARAEELAGKREKLARHLARVTTVEGPMEDKNPQQKGDGSSGEQGNRRLDQFGTHGGPASGTPGTQPKSQPPPAPAKEQGGGEGMGGGRETGGASEVPSDVEKLAARAVERVKSIARGLIDKLPADVLPGGGSEEDEDEGGSATPARRPKAPRRPAKSQKAKPAARSARSGRSKGGKVAKAGKAAKKATRGAKKSARGAKQPKPSSKKGARAKAGGKKRPSSRKGKK
jgi:valyl-tRNA synthetase